MNGRFEYIVAFVFLLVVLLLTSYLFLYDDFVSESEEKITGIISFLAIGFGVFQFWINELNTDRRKLYDLRYNTYKEFIIHIDGISEILNVEMMGDEIGSIHNLVSRLMNKANRIKSDINLNGDFLFPYLYLKPETESILSIINRILIRTDEFRMNLESTNNKSKEIARSFLHSTERMQWNNEIREYLSELHTSKYDFYRALRTYF